MIHESEVCDAITKDVREVLRKYGYPDNIIQYGLTEQLGIHVEIVVRRLNGVMDEKSVSHSGFVYKGVRK